MPTACPAKTWLKVNPFVSHTDATTTRDHDGFVAEGIVDVRQSGVGSGGRFVDLGLDTSSAKPRADVRD